MAENDSTTTGQVARPSQLPLPLSGAALRDQALDNLEAWRADYVARARAVAVTEIKEWGYVTADDIHRLCPVPKGIDGRVIGAVLRPPLFKPIAYVNSRRRVNHGRPIRRFVLGGSRA